MAERPQRSRKVDWFSLLIGSGFAAAIAGATAVGTELARSSQADYANGCNVAVAILRNEALSPYLKVAERDKLLAAAARRAKACLEN